MRNAGADVEGQVRMRRSGFGAMSLVLALAGWARAQSAGEGQPLETLKISTRVVGVAAVVRQKDGEPVGGLSKADFQLKEDGKPQEIRYFSQGSDLPLTLALMVDTSGSQRAFIGDEEIASDVFFDEMVKQKNDRAMLVQFDTNVLQLQGMTSAAGTLKLALARLTEPHQSLRGGTLLYDAIYVTAKNVVAAQPGRKALVILTDGEDNGSRTSIDQAIEEAQRADAAIYSVYYSRLQSAYGGPMGSHAGRSALEKMSGQTGGKVFEVSEKASLKMIFAEIAEDMRLEYLLGYNPPASDAGKFHKIELKAEDKHLSVQSRKGYYAK